MAETWHATCVAFQDRAVLIKGAAGQGKSSLALRLMALGCTLVADDRVILAPAGGGVVAQAPDTLRGLIEARGVGILQAQYVGEARVTLVVDLDQVEKERLPTRRHIAVLGCELPLIWRAESAFFAEAILQLLKVGWSDR